MFGARQGDEKYEAKYDLNGDGEIGFSDFVIFAQNFGKEATSPVVTIPDANLRAAIETALGKASDVPITRAEMATFDSLAASDADITDLTGLEYAVNLTWLDLASNDITNVSVLVSLTNLTHLILSSNNITDLAGLVANTGLDTGDTVDVTDNPLNVTSQITHIPSLKARGVRVSFTPSPAPSSPDLIVESPSVSDSTLTPGQSFTLSATVRNQGAGVGKPRAPARRRAGGEIPSLNVSRPYHISKKWNLRQIPDVSTNIRSCSPVSHRVPLQYPIHSVSGMTFQTGVSNHGEASLRPSLALRAYRRLSIMGPIWRSPVGGLEL